METVAARGGTVDSVTAQLDDPAEVIAAAHRHFVRLARSDPDWSWLVVRGNLSHDVVLAALGVRRARHQARRADRPPVRRRRTGVLRLLGLTTTDAVEVARRPLPPLALRHG